MFFIPVLLKTTVKMEMKILTRRKTVTATIKIHKIHKKSTLP